MRSSFALLIFFAASIAVAQNRTFVSVNGSDVNPCSTTAPCRSFTAAASVVASGGDVVVLDSGGYGPVTISKPLSIIAPAGVYAGISVSGSSGILIDNVGAGVIVLRGLSITGIGGTNGIEMDYAQNLHLDHVDIRNFRNGSAVLMQSGYSDHEPHLVIRDSVFREVAYGVNVQSTVFGQSVSVDHVRFDMAYGTGIQLANNASVAVSNCIFHDGNRGVYATPTTGSVYVTVDQSEFTDLLTGVELYCTSSGSAHAWIGRSTFAASTAAIRSGPGALISFGNNQNEGPAVAWDQTIPLQ